MEQNSKNKVKLRKNLIFKEFNIWQSILITVFVMGVLIAFVYFCNIPNPNMILIAGLVICSSLFGFAGGVPASIIMLAYTLFFFSDNHSFIAFSGQNIYKVVVSLFGIAVDMLFVCILKRREQYAYSEIHDLTEQLRLENQRLQKVSFIDALTGIGNRLALRQDYEDYKHDMVCIIMMDVDNFKSFNDFYGHDIGDKVLVQTAKMISEIFGEEFCFRFGGDEFLIIYPESNKELCLEKMNSIVDNSRVITVDGKELPIDYSIGYVIDKPGNTQGFHKLIKVADERMYKAKRAGKNRVVGE